MERAVTAAERLVADATARVVARTGADPRAVRDAIAGAVQVHLAEMDAANGAPESDECPHMGPSQCDCDELDEHDLTPAQMLTRDLDEYYDIVREGLRAR